MSVKVEKIEPKPQFTIKVPLGGLTPGSKVLNVEESEAREIYEGLAVYFAGCGFEPSKHCTWKDAAERWEKAAAEKDAEIARLKAQCSWYAGISSPYTEIRRLRGWLEKIKKHETTACACCDNLEDPTTAGIWATRALAGGKCPD